MRTDLPSRIHFRDLVEDSSAFASSYFYALPELETSRLRLRKLRLRDAADIFSYSSDEQVARYVLWEPQKHLREARAYIRDMRRLYRQGRPSSWAIELKAEKKVIGTIGYMWYSPENRSAEIGYSLARAYWNQGLMTEALARVLRSAFEDLKLHRAEAQHDIRNPASGRVMEKCGMRREGVLRSRIYNKGEYVDTAIYAILRDEFASGA